MPERSEEQHWKAYRWIVAGTQRMAVLKALRNIETTPTMIRQASTKHNERIDMSSASKILRRFVERGIAICINEAEKTGRLYRLTELGEMLKERLVSED